MLVGGSHVRVQVRISPLPLSVHRDDDFVSRLTALASSLFCHAIAAFFVRWDEAGRRDRNVGTLVPTVRIDSDRASPQWATGRRTPALGSYPDHTWTNHTGRRAACRETCRRPCSCLAPYVTVPTRSLQRLFPCPSLPVGKRHRDWRRLDLGTGPELGSIGLGKLARGPHEHSWAIEAGKLGCSPALIELTHPPMRVELMSACGG